MFLWFEDFEDATHLEGFLLLIPWGTAASLYGYILKRQDATSK